MARWLAGLALGCGLAVIVAGDGAWAQKAPPEKGSQSESQPDSAAANTSSSPQPTSRGGSAAGSTESSGTTISSEARRERQRDERSRGDVERRGENERRGEGRRPGPPFVGGPGWWNAFAWRRVAEAVRRNGEPLELLPLLLLPQARAEIGLDEQQFKPKVDAYMAQMQQRIDEERQQAQEAREQGTQPIDWAKLYAERMEKENEHFEKLLSQLTASQQERLIGLFVQARGYRAISNRLVSSKIGMDPTEAANKREMVESIREDVMEKSKDGFQRLFEKGGGPKEFEKFIRENQRKIDDRIEKQLSEDQRSKLTALRGQEVAEPRDWLLRGVEMPRPPAPPRPDRRAGGRPQPKSDCCSNDCADGCE